MESWGTQVLISGSAAFLQRSSGEAQIPAKLRKPAWCSTGPEPPHIVLPRAPFHPCSDQKPQNTRGAPTFLPRKALFYLILSETALDELPCGAPDAILFFLDEAAWDSASAAAEIFANH